jgi:hypothetical protein
MLMAEGTPGGDGLRRHGLHGRRDILAATLAVNHRALGAFWSGEHEVQYRRIKGESNPQALILSFAVRFQTTLFVSERFCRSVRRKPRFIDYS